MDDLLVNDGMDEEILTDYDPASLIEDWQKNVSWSISLTVLKTSRNSIAYALLNNESKIIYLGQQFVINHTEPKGNGPLSMVDISAPHIYFTCQDHRQYDQQSKVWSIDEAMHWTFDDNVLDFTWEVVGSFPTVQIDNFGDANALSMLSDILKKFGGVLEADNKHLIIYSEAEWGLTTNKQIRYQFNTDEVQMSIDTGDVKTVIRGYGKQNEDGSYVFPPVTYTSPNVYKYEHPKIADPIRDERFTDPESMLAYLPSQLNDEPNVSITAPLKIKEDVQRGEHRMLIYEPMDLDIDVQIIAYKKYPAVNKPPEVTSSNTVKDAVDVMFGFSTAASTVNKAINTDGTIKDNALGTTVSESVQKINDVITGDGNIDLNKTEGRLTADKVSIGSGTQFSDGYDPSTIYRLTILQQTSIAKLRSWLWGTGSGGGISPNSEQSETPNVIHFNPKVPNPTVNPDGTVDESGAELLSLILEAVRGDIWVLQQDITKLEPWLTTVGGVDALNPTINDPRNPGSSVDLGTLLTDFQLRLSALEGGS